MSGVAPHPGNNQTCARCGGPIDNDTIHVNHIDGCDDDVPWWCDCPEVCADCCTDPDCPFA